MAIDNILSNENYISKDFQSIYKEYVEAVGKLNNKWLVDGEGNESDPGIVLLKLLAAAEDKINYITDRANLENYPDTVQIEANARSNFSPVYNMHWYRSGTGYVTILNNGSEEITLPDYLMLCSEDSSHVHTINQTSEIIPAGEARQLPVIEGKIKTLTINGSDCITINAFVDNRLYLDDYNIAENGIYVTPYNIVSGENPGSAASWKQVDNIYVQNWSAEFDKVAAGKYFQFRIDPQSNKPYLQFVDDLVDKIGDGLKIRYILSNGVEGNVSSGKITKVYTSDSELVVDSDNLIISNILPIGNGKDPETIESARRNYFKDIDICNTLVTLRDYANAIYLADGLVSNCFVCDRTNDIQLSYKIVSGNSTNEYVEPVEGRDSLSVMNLKFYGLTYSDIDSGLDDQSTETEKNLYHTINYNKSFDLINPGTTQEPLSIPNDVANYIDSTRAINHEFVSIRNDRKICCFKNYYTLNINLLFRQRLSEEQQIDIIDKVKYALLNRLNAHEVDFGERITYQKVQQIIYDADTRILGASISGLDDIDFKTSAVYWSPYVGVSAYPVDTPDKGTPLSYIAKITGETGTNQLIDGRYCDYYGKAYLYQYGADGALIDSVLDTTYLFTKISSTHEEVRPHDIPAIPSDETSRNFTAFYAEEKSWIDNYYTGTTPSGSIYVAVTKPSTAYLSTDNIYHVQLTRYDGTPASYVEISKYPTTPTQITYGGESYAKINNKYYNLIFVQEDSYYHQWKYDNQPYLILYNGNPKSYGQFFEKQINSEFIEADQSYDSNFEIGQNTLTGDFQTEIYAKSALAGKAPIFDTNFEFRPTIADKDAILQDNIAYIKPNLKLSFQEEYQLGGLEYIQILSPQYDTIANYSFYVYMGYYNSTSTITSLTIGANQDYRLQNGEFIIFYYRSSDSDPFSFTVYNQGNIICPSRTVQLNNDSRLNFQKSIAQAVGSNTTFYQGVANSTLQTSITQSLSLLEVLKSQDSCDVKRAERHEVQAYAFVTADGYQDENGITTTYKLRWDYDEDIPDDYKYFRVLESGEQFNVYTIKGSQITLETQLGPGDLLLSNSNTELTYSYNTDGSYVETPTGITLYYSHTIINEISPTNCVLPIFGVSATHSSGPSIPGTSANDYNSATYSQQLEVFSSKVNSQFDPNNNYDYVDNVEVGTAITGNKLAEIVAYVKAYVQSMQWTDTTEPDIQIKYHNQYNDSGNIRDQDVVYFNIEYSVQQNTLFELSGKFRLYAEDKIQYRGETETSYKTVEFSNDTTIPQLIRSALAVDIDSNTSQLLQNVYEVSPDNNQQVKLKVVQSVEGFDIDGNSIFTAEPIDDNGLKIISSNQSIQALGGKQKLSQLSTIYAADEITDNIQSGTTLTEYKSQTDFIIFNFDADGQLHDLDIPNITAGEGYIIYVKNMGPTGNAHDLTHVQVKAGLTSLSNLYGTMTYDGDEDDALEAGENFTINMNNPQAAKLQISAQASGSPKVSWEIQREITPYQYNDLSAEARSAILSKMGELDYDNKFKIPETDPPIANPLAAASFLNPEHIYNKFTICQMDTVDTQIK